MRSTPPVLRALLIVSLAALVVLTFAFVALSGPAAIGAPRPSRLPAVDTSGGSPGPEIAWAAGNAAASRALAAAASEAQRLADEEAARAAAAAKRRAAVPSARVAPAPGPTVAGLPAILWRIAGCESAGNPNAEPNYGALNRSSGASGAFQWIPSSWRSYGYADRYGVPEGRLASPSQQQEAALDMYQRSGLQPWASSRACWS